MVALVLEQQQHLLADMIAMGTMKTLGTLTPHVYDNAGEIQYFSVHAQL